MKECQVQVRGNDTLGPDTFLMTLRGETIARDARPGHFVMVQAAAAPDPLLRRPMSICQAGRSETLSGDPDCFQILFQVVGTGTRLLSRLTPGSEISCLGPLGNGFRPPAFSSAPALLVAGGIGIAPFPFLAERLAEAGTSWKLLYGARSAGQLVGLDWFRRLGSEPVLTTEDGTAGERGLVTGPLGRSLEEAGSEVQVYACGPEAMLRAVARICEERRVRCQLSLEGMMPCGFGVCLGCSVRAAGPGENYLRMCTEGPVFDREEIDW